MSAVRPSAGLDDAQVGSVVGAEAISSSLLSRRGPAHSRRPRRRRGWCGGEVSGDRHPRLHVIEPVDRREEPHRRTHPARHRRVSVARVGDRRWRRHDAPAHVGMREPVDRRCAGRRPGRRVRVVLQVDGRDPNRVGRSNVARMSADRASSANGLARRGLPPPSMTGTSWRMKLLNVGSQAQSPARPGLARRRPRPARVVAGTRSQRVAVASALRDGKPITACPGRWDER